MGQPQAGVLPTPPLEGLLAHSQLPADLSDGLTLRRRTSASRSLVMISSTVRRRIPMTPPFPVQV